MRQILFANWLVGQALAFGFILEVDIFPKNTLVNIQHSMAFASLIVYELVHKLNNKAFKSKSRILKVEANKIKYRK